MSIKNFFLFPNSGSLQKLYKAICWGTIEEYTMETNEIIAIANQRIINLKKELDEFKVKNGIDSKDSKNFGHNYDKLPVNEKIFRAKSNRGESVKELKRLKENLNESK